MVGGREGRKQIRKATRTKPTAAVIMGLLGLLISRFQVRVLGGLPRTEPRKARFGGPFCLSAKLLQTNCQRSYAKTNAATGPLPPCLPALLRGWKKRQADSYHHLPPQGNVHGVKCIKPNK